jgi:hypothetical protein
MKYSLSTAFSMNRKLLLTEPDDVAFSALAANGVIAPTRSNGRMMLEFS